MKIEDRRTVARPTVPLSGLSDGDVFMQQDDESVYMRMRRFIIEQEARPWLEEATKRIRPGWPPSCNVLNLTTMQGENLPANCKVIPLEAILAVRHRPTET